MDSGTYQPIIPNCMPSSYPSGRFSLITLRTALSAARRSVGSAARYWATVEAVMLARIAAELCGGQVSCTGEKTLGLRLNRKRRSRSFFVIGCSLIGVYLHLGGKRDMG